MSPGPVIVPTGSANLASVVAAFRRLGAAPVVARRPTDVVDTRSVVLPGVGAFGAAMGTLERSGMREALATRVGEGRPTLAICVGMQLLTGSSEESRGVRGLGCVPGQVRRFSDEVRVPQLGWNRVEASPECRFVVDGWAYFANSYRLGSVPEGWAGAMTDHGGPFVSALERGDVLACQFHPELSGAWGSGVLGRWLQTSGRAS